MTRATEDSDWIMGDAMSTPGFTFLMRECGMAWRRLLVGGGHALAFIDWRMWGTMAAALESADLRQHPLLVWDKGRARHGCDLPQPARADRAHEQRVTPRPPSAATFPNVLRYPPTANENHPTEKPTTLLETLASVVTPPGACSSTASRGRGRRSWPPSREGYAPSALKATNASVK